LISKWTVPKAKDIPSGTTFINNQLVINAPALGLSYSGKYNNDTFEGFFKQGGMKVNVISKTKLVNRPQTPKAPLITKLRKLVLQTQLIKTH
jgi:hypothetical protein